MVDFIRYILRIKAIFHNLKMCCAFLAGMVKHERRVFCRFLTLGIFTVKDAKGIGFHSSFAILTQYIRIQAFQPRFQQIPVCGAAIRTAQGIKLQCYISDTYVR